MRSSTLIKTASGFSQHAKSVLYINMNQLDEWSLFLYDSSSLQLMMNSQWPKLSAEACCSSVSGPLHNSGGLSSAAVCASRHNGPFRWRAHQHIHRLIPSIVAIAQDSSFIQTQLSWKGKKEKRRGMGHWKKRLGTRTAVSGHSGEENSEVRRSSEKQKQWGETMPSLLCFPPWVYI